MRVNKGFVLNRIKGKHDYAERVIKQLESQLDSFETGEERTTVIETKYGDNIECRPGDTMTFKLSKYVDTEWVGLLCEMTEDGEIIASNEGPAIYLITGKKALMIDGEYELNIPTAEFNWSTDEPYKQINKRFDLNNAVSELDKDREWAPTDGRYVVAIPLIANYIFMYMIKGGA